MAFSRSPTLDRSLCGLCQYPVKNQEGISWVAQLVPDRGSKMGVYSSLPGAGGDPLRRQPDGEKSRTQSQSQVSAQQAETLYESLDTLQEQVLYYDTDIVVYK
ncbi:unnamed protein product [Porites lobata]|uniref:Uncharacterized protein n=1 Tax=Porites lobata TaxID=104759 RepID=A0ABN8RCC1_9CNID|nr:unnamed protein product [Porites lobata]